MSTSVYRSGGAGTDAYTPNSLQTGFAHLDKLKRVPQCAARKLTAVSSQLSAFERHEIVAACKEYGGIVIQCRYLVVSGNNTVSNGTGPPEHLPAASYGGAKGIWGEVSRVRCPDRPRTRGPQAKRRTRSS